MPAASTGSRRPALLARAARLLPGLFLARVDGKSPVEYITAEADKERVRRVARALLAAPVATPADVCERVAEGVDRMSETDIAYVQGRRVWDSRGRPTVEADVLLEGGAVGRAMAPAGASTGSGEALDLRDGGAAFGGYDVTHAVGHVNGEIAQAVLGRDALDQEGIDRALIALDGTPAKTAARRQRHRGGVDGGGARRRRGRGRAALPLPRRRRGHAAAAAADPDFRRRRPCRAAHRHPGLPGGLPGGAQLRRRRWTGPPRSTAPPAA